MPERPNISLEVDAEEAIALLEGLRNLMTGKQFERALYGVMRDTSRHVASILRKDLPRKYRVKGKDITQAVKRPQITSGSFGGIGCIIPIRGRRGSVGGTYAAFGEAPGWNIPPGGYRVSAHIVKGATTMLPERMPRTGHKKPFRNSTAKKLNMVAFSRLSANRLPIRSVVGIAIPQMPMNRSKDEVQRDIANYLKGRVEHRIQAFIKNGR